MGGTFKKCVEEMRKLAAKGKVTGKFSVREEDIILLQAEGFEVTLSKDFRTDTRDVKNLRQVRIDWDNPKKTAGLASQLKDMVEDYRLKRNSASSTNKLKRAKVKKAFGKLGSWIAGADPLKNAYDEHIMNPWKDDNPWD